MGDSMEGSTEDSIGSSIGSLIGSLIGDCFNVRSLSCTPGSMFVYAIAGRVEARSEQRRGPRRE